MAGLKVLVGGVISCGGLKLGGSVIMVVEYWAIYVSESDPKMTSSRFPRP